MSKFINEIIKDIIDNPTQWVRNGECGLKKEGIKLSNFGNGKLISIVRVEINGIDCFHQTTWKDKYRLEEVYSWWMKNASIAMMEA